MHSQYEASDKIICSMARLAPALGWTGTIISLIRTFGHITDTNGLVGYMGICAVEHLLWRRLCQPLLFTFIK